MFDTSKEDRELIGKIVTRWFKEHPEWVQDNPNFGMIDLNMDLRSAHADVPMDLEALANADQTTFTHDVAGIMAHMDREIFPGYLKNCFRPRTALP